jgi:ketosteroid isomerase-like protein
VKFTPRPAIENPMIERHLLHRLTLGAMMAVAAACAVPKEQTADVTAAIAAANEKLSALVAKGDSAGIARLYAANAMVMPANMDAVTGSANIARLFQDAMDAGMHGQKMETGSIDVGGDLAVETGTYVITDANGGLMDRGKYAVIWKREDGAWKIYRDIWTTSTPAPQAGQAAAGGVVSPPD